ncbi:hypothetical protein [Clostridium grantii]|uniref:Uncharacterized protein n=1 Tax=Clostridium grantii DSM 8605 TaxID=1121316 RepID=A0A1M5T336_9CLOT|nr:hypothetical protein [Clostridium grantii]SHH45151.1 hypothetical protein SAMN02745207_01175 [Clostridium grantii DSM 8605]
MRLLLKNKENEILFQSDGENVSLNFKREYVEGDKLVFDLEKELYAYVNIDKTLKESMVYAPEGFFEYSIPFSEKKRAYHPEAFAGENHIITLRKVSNEDIHTRRNLAMNTLDLRKEINYFPHSDANIVTRDESVFESRNAIDGVCETSGHGNYPYQSWGGGLRDDLAFYLYFGRKVKIDEIRLYLRADYINDHDINWYSGTFTFSNGTIMDITMEKTTDYQSYKFDEIEIDSLKFSSLKRELSAAFSALIQIEVYGRG